MSTSAPAPLEESGFRDRNKNPSTSSLFLPADVADAGGNKFGITAPASLDDKSGGFNGRGGAGHAEGRGPICHGEHHQFDQAADTRPGGDDGGDSGGRTPRALRCWRSDSTGELHEVEKWEGPTRSVRHVREPGAARPKVDNDHDADSDRERSGGAGVASLAAVRESSRRRNRQDTTTGTGTVTHTKQQRQRSTGVTVLPSRRANSPDLGHDSDYATTNNNSGKNSNRHDDDSGDYVPSWAKRDEPWSGPRSHQPQHRDERRSPPPHDNNGNYSGRFAGSEYAGCSGGSANRARSDAGGGIASYDGGRGDCRRGGSPMPDPSLLSSLKRGGSRNARLAFEKEANMVVFGYTGRCPVPHHTMISTAGFDVKSADGVCLDNPTCSFCLVLVREL